MATRKEKSGHDNRHSKNPRSLPHQRGRVPAPQLRLMTRQIIELPQMRGLSFSDQKVLLFETFERVIIGRELHKAGGHIETAAAALGLHRQSLEHIMRKRDMMAGRPTRQRRK